MSRQRKLKRTHASVENIGAGISDFDSNIIQNEEKRPVLLSPLEDEELESILREYSLDDNQLLLDAENIKKTKLSETTEDQTSLISLYGLFVFIIIIGIIINLILLYDLIGRDRKGKYIEIEDKNMAAVNGVGLALMLTIIFMGGIYLLKRDVIEIKMGTMLIILLMVSFLIIFLMGLFIGEYINVGHVWTPAVNLQPSD